MASLKEIKDRMDGIRETQKITNAMYLIASAKMKKAKSELDRTRPFFDALKTEIKRVFRTVDDKIDGRYFYPDEDDKPLDGTYGYLVITADKGLAGAYNQTVIKQAAAMVSAHPDARLFVVGEYGRRYFKTHGIKTEDDFCFTAQNPNLVRAYEISNTLLKLYDSGEIQKLYVIYTDFGSGMSEKVISTRVLPLHQSQFKAPSDERTVEKPFEFQPSPCAVLEKIVPDYLLGFIYSALVDSFCCEQSARMTAMDSANRNAEEILAELTRDYNYTRQKEITQEITEIAAGAKYQLMKRSAKND